MKVLQRRASPPEPARVPASGAHARYAVGIVNYRTYADLERCLASVKTQTLAPTRVLVVDNDPVASELRELERRHPEVEWQPRRNRGFSEAANFILARFRDGDHCEEFFLLLNPDVRLEPEFAERLLAGMQRFEQAALGSGKLLRPDTGGIDSAGIVLPRHRRPRDRGSEEPDRGQYESTEFVFGASGAALMVRASALDDLSIEGEVFDEDFFTYHEDTDLAWRANRLGWRVLYVPGARALHERHWRRDRRFVIPDRVRRHSFKNHYLQLIKNESAGGFLVNLPAIACWEILRLGYALLRDRALLAGYADAWQGSRSAWRKRRALQQRIRDKERGSADPAPRARPLSRRARRR
jgi:GT2 family glycosyltransferase